MPPLSYAPEARSARSKSGGRAAALLNRQPQQPRAEAELLLSLAEAEHAACAADRAAAEIGGARTS